MCVAPYFYLPSNQTIAYFDNYRSVADCIAGAPVWGKAGRDVLRARESRPSKYIESVYPR